MNTLFVGIDVSTRHNQAAAMNFNQDKYFNISFENTPESSDMLFDAIIGIIQKYDLDHVIVVAESTSVYDFHICAFLLDKFSTVGTPTEVYSVNAKTIANYKKSYVELEKSDPGDAMICADFARVGRTKNLNPFRASQTIALNRLTRERYHLSEQLIREKNYMLNNVYLKVSGLVALEPGKRPFSDNFGATALIFLTEFDDPYLLESLSLDETVAYLRNSSKRPGIADYDKMADLLQKCIRASFRLDKVSYDLLTVSISASVNLIKCIEQQIKVIDKTIEREMKGIYPNEYQCLLSIRGIGPVLAAGILSEIGDISCFKNDASLAKYAGFHWKKNDSGNFIAENRHMSSSCNKYLRYYITQATQSSIYHGFDFTADFYNRKLNEASNHRHKRALVLTSRKLTRLIFTLLRDKKMYVPMSHEATDK